MNLPATPPRPRYSAWLLLLVYWLSIPGFVPLAAASVATISSEREVHFVFENGILDHRAHVHERLMIPIAGIAAHDDDGDDDPVLHFVSSSEAISNSSTSLKVASATVEGVQWQGISFQASWPASAALERPAARPPPLASMGMICLRTTVLLV